MRTLIILPTYNEIGTVGTMLEAVRAASPDAELLVVDDASPDGTGDVARAAAAELRQISVLSRATKDGLGRAYLAGFQWGLDRGFDVLVEMDCDFSHDPASLPQLVQALNAEHDLAIGSRYVPGGSTPDWPASRRILSRAGNAWANYCLSLGVKDATGGFRAYRADLLRRMPLHGIQARGYGFQIEMTYKALRCGASVVEVPIRFIDRAEGTSKMSSFVVLEALALVTAWGYQERTGSGGMPKGLALSGVRAS
jgi:dolichol-phosphate mannosyltransferase